MGRRMKKPGQMRSTLAEEGQWSSRKQQITGYVRSQNWAGHFAFENGWVVRIQHAACCSVDSMNEGVSVQLGYRVLAQLVSEMLYGNCTGVTFQESGGWRRMTNLSIWPCKCSPQLAILA